MGIRIPRPSRFHRLVLGMVGLLVLGVGGLVFGIRAVRNEYACLLSTPADIFVGSSRLIDTNSGAVFESSTRNLPHHSIKPEDKSISPDGKYVAYVEDSPGSSVVALKIGYLNMGALWRVIPIRDSIPTATDGPTFGWSRDGHWLTYLWAAPGGKHWIAVADGSGEKKAIPLDLTERAIPFYEGWSLDNNYIGLSIKDGNNRSFLFLSVPDLRIMASIAIPAGDEVYEYWLPQGYRKAYLETRNEQTYLGVFSFEHGFEREVLLPTPSGDIHYDPSMVWWSPDGQYFALMPYEYPSGSGNLYIFTLTDLALVGAKDHIIVAHIGGPFTTSPAFTYWSSDQRTLFFLQYDEQQTQPDGQAVTNLVSFNVESGQTQTISENIRNDPRRLFGSGWVWTIHYNGSAGASLELSDLDNKTSSTVLQGLDSCCYVRELPDGDTIVGSSEYLNGQTVLWWIHNDGTGLHQIESGAKSIVMVDWSDNGKWFTFVTNERTVSSDVVGNASLGIVDVQSEQYRIIMDGINNYQSFHAIPSPDGKMVALSWWAPLPETIHTKLIYTINGQVAFSKQIESATYSLKWAPDSSQIFTYLVAPNETRYEIVRPDGSLVRTYSVSVYSYSGTDWTHCD